jgi:hypothetical protein
MRFKDWVLEKELNEFWKEVNEFTRKSAILNNHIPCGTTLEWVKETLAFINEGIIKPELISINTYNENKLNNEFKKYNINFIKDNQNLNAYYDKKTDTITIIYSEKDSFNEIEALIGHEMVHKEQHKKSNEYFKQSGRTIEKINELIQKKTKLLKEPGGVLKYSKELNKLNSEINKIYNYFLYLTPYEKMAYAYQFVYMNKNLNPNDIIKKLKNSVETKDFPITSDFKKYVAMYWLLRNKKIEI